MCSTTRLALRFVRRMQKSDLQQKNLREVISSAAGVKFRFHSVGVHISQAERLIMYAMFLEHYAFSNHYQSSWNWRIEIEIFNVVIFPAGCWLDPTNLQQKSTKFCSPFSDTKVYKCRRSIHILPSTSIMVVRS